VGGWEGGGSESLAQRVCRPPLQMGESLKRTNNSEALLQACIGQASNTTFYRGKQPFLSLPPPLPPSLNWHIS